MRLIPAVQRGSCSEFVGDDPFLELGDAISNLAACYDKFIVYFQAPGEILLRWFLCERRFCSRRLSRGSCFWSDAQSPSRGSATFFTLIMIGKWPYFLGLFLSNVQGTGSCMRFQRLFG